MGKIDKEKLLKEISKESVFYDIVKDFTEEPEQPIDFDALYDEWFSSPCKHDVCVMNPCSKPQCFRDFLKSKNLTAPKQFEIPVKRIWKLKKKYVKYFISKGIDGTPFDNYTEEPECAELYDMHEEPDYSKIKGGSLMEFKEKNCTNIYADYFTHFKEGTICCLNGHYSEKLYDIRIVELEKE